MDLETAQITIIAKLPTLKQGEYDMWRLKIEQYFQVQDYALWDVIENENSFKPAAKTTTNADGTSTTLIPGPLTTEEKVQKKNDMKARSMLLLALPNEHLITFNQYKDAKTLFAAIQTRFGDNKATKKTQKTLLKQITNVVNTAYGVSTANTQVSPASTQVSSASTQVSTANLCDDTVYAFLASQPNGSQLVHEDLEQIHEDDLEEMDLKWQLALLSMRTRRFFQKTRHFARECRGPRNQDSKNRNQDSSRRTTNVEETSSKAMLAIDGAGFDWSYMVDDEVPTNMALMAFSDSGGNMVPRAVLMKTHLRSLNTVRPKTVNNARPNSAVVNVVRANQVNAVKDSSCWVWRPTKLNSASITVKKHNYGHPQKENQGYVDSRCSRRMTRNMSYLSDFKEFDGGYVTFGGGAKGGKITSKGTLKTGKLDFEDVYFVKELQFNLFSVSQMCDKKNSVLFTNTGCFVLSPEFMLADESQVLLKVPRKNNMYSVDIKNIVPKESLTCLVANATLDESMLWHRRLGHVKFKTINKLVKENLVRGLLSKRFENDQTCVACLKGKQHKAFCKSKIQNYITQPLFMLHMDLFGPTFMSSLINKKYCLIVTNDYSRFTWVFFLATKDETSGILKRFITEIENLVDKKVKIIRCDNGTEFKNRVMSEFCEQKGIKREFSVARTPQQNGVAERRNRTLIEAARTMLADSKLPTTFWAEVVNTTCYVQNRVLVVNPSLMNCKFDGKSDEGFFVGYSMNSKAFRVYNIRTRKVEENLHIRFLEDKPIIAGDGPKWLFDIDVLTKSMNYVPVVAGTNSNDLVGTEESIGAGHSSKETGSSQDYILMPLWKDGSLFDSFLKNASNDEPQPSSDVGKKDDEFTTAPLEATYADFFGDETEIDMRNITTIYLVPSTLNTRIHKDHSLDHVIGDVQSGVQTRRMTKTTNVQGFISAVYEGKTHEDLHTSIRLFLAYASFKDFVVYQMDVKNAFLYGKIEEEVYVYQPLGIASTPMETSKPLLKDAEAEDVGCYFLYLMIGSLMYLTASRPDIMFAVYACERFQVTPKVSHLHAIKRIFRYLKGQPKMGLWYPKDSPFALEAYTDSDYAGASLDRKSTTGGCQFLRSKLISWQCKKQTIVANSTTKAKYFWQTATESTLHNGEMEITATTDGKVKIVTEGSIRRHLKLEDSDGISNFPTTEIFKQLALMGYGEGSTHPVESHHTPTSAPPTSQPPISSTSRRITRQEYVVPRPKSPTQTPIADEAASTGMDVRLGGATTTVTSLDAGQDNELMALCTKLSNKVESLEIDLKQTKQIYGTDFTKLIKKVKKLEKTVKTSQARRKGRHEHDMEFDFEFTAAEEVYTAKKGVSTAELVSTVGASVSTASVVQQRKQMGSYTLQQLRGYSFDEIKSLFEGTMKRVKTFTLMESDVDRTVPKIAARSSKRDAKEEVGQEISKRQKIGESSQQAKEPRNKEPDELSQEELQ
ncbi:putative ribonuclease H-like domain-containing protein [Tanacetum coccineum]